MDERAGGGGSQQPVPLLSSVGCWLSIASSTLARTIGVARSSLALFAVAGRGRVVAGWWWWLAGWLRWLGGGWAVRGWKKRSGGRRSGGSKKQTNHLLRLHYRHLQEACEPLQLYKNKTEGPLDRYATAKRDLQQSCNHWWKYKIINKFKISKKRALFNPFTWGFP